MMAGCYLPIWVMKLHFGSGCSQGGILEAPQEVCLCPVLLCLPERVTVSLKLSVFVLLLPFISFVLPLFLWILNWTFFGVRQTWVGVQFCYLLCNLGQLTYSLDTSVSLSKKQGQE